MLNLQPFEESGHCSQDSKTDRVRLDFHSLNNLYALQFLIKVESIHRHPSTNVQILLLLLFNKMKKCFAETICLLSFIFFCTKYSSKRVAVALTHTHTPFFPLMVVNLSIDNLSKNKSPAARSTVSGETRNALRGVLSSMGALGITQDSRESSLFSFSVTMTLKK